jgi:hypothetical protein
MTAPVITNAGALSLLRPVYGGALLPPAGRGGGGGGRIAPMRCGRGVLLPPDIVVINCHEVAYKDYQPETG